MAFRTVSRIAALAALAVAAGCDQTARVPPPCPAIVVVGDTAELTQFRPGPGRDLTDVVAEGRIDRFDGFCETDRNRDGTGEIAVELQLFFVIASGPANTTRFATYEYFVAIADTSERILAKQTFSAEVAFEGNRNRLTAFETLVQTIPVTAGQDGGAFTVYVGFQLTPDQLAYNRSKRR
ncbi:MAG: hypothetical protein FJX53_02830 [Alphaproteobacteria bacterium]|nr:hypothetical protein [Alphaproteobacteria bacterium]